jgi:hypothetical protein
MVRDVVHGKPFRRKETNRFNKPDQWLLGNGGGLKVRIYSKESVKYRCDSSADISVELEIFA